MVTAVAIAIAWGCRHVSDAGLDWAGIDVHRVLPLVAVYLAVAAIGGFLYGGILLAGHQFLVTRMYAELRDPATRQAPAIPREDTERARLLARPAIAIALAVVVGAVGSAALLVSQLDLTQDVAITAHRGAKVAAPENTLAAFRTAMDAGATYAELDVQHTRDRRIVVVHDGDLMRMGDDPRKVSELTAAEIATIDIGRKYHAKFTGEYPPTLEDVIDLVRGRMRINIELKYNVPDPGLAPAVVELLRRTDFLDQVVITSLDYAALKQVESLEPRLRTGPHRHRRRRQRRAHGGRLPEPQCRPGDAFAHPARARRRQGSARLDGERARADAAHDRARRGQRHHRRPGAAGPGDAGAQGTHPGRDPRAAAAGAVQPAAAGALRPDGGRTALGPLWGASSGPVLRPSAGGRRPV